MITLTELIGSVLVVCAVIALFNDKEHKHG